MQDILSVLRHFSAILFKFINQGISLTLCSIHCWKALDVSINNTLAILFLVIFDWLRILMTARESNEGYISECIISLFHPRSFDLIPSTRKYDSIGKIWRIWLIGFPGVKKIYPCHLANAKVLIACHPAIYMLYAKNWIILNGSETTAPLS